MQDIYGNRFVNALQTGSFQDNDAQNVPIFVHESTHLYSATEKTEWNSMIVEA